MSFSKVSASSQSSSFWGASSRILLVVISLLILAFLSACGSNNSSTGVNCPGSTGNFTNASLPAGSQWTYQLSGWFVNQSLAYQPYVAAGVLTVDGNGNITSGFDDAFQSSITGAYHISSNGTGSMTINLTGLGQSLVWAVTLSSATPGALYIMEADTGFNAAGTAYQQTPAAFAAAPTGTFAFHTHILPAGNSLAGSAASVGVMAVNAGTITTLNEDVLLAGLAPSQRTLGNAVTPVFTVPDSTGVGTVTFADSQGQTTAYNYYVIDANTYLLFETDGTGGGLGLGRLEAQSAPGTFLNSSLNGGYIFGSRGDTTGSAAVGINSVGQFTTDGGGNVLSGTYDTVRDGSPSLGAAITSSGTASVYNVETNGRVSITLNANGTVIGLTGYLADSARGFFLVNNDTTRVEDGTLEAQSSSSFATTDFNGQFAFGMHGATGGLPLDRNGTVTSDGNGNLGLAEVANSGGTINVPGCLSGTYTVTSNGRVTASISSLSGNMIVYMVSPNEFYVLQGDSQAQMFGGATLQTANVPDPPGAF